jgi:hypothetical protein
MRAKPAHPKRALKQRALLAFIVALALAPFLANIWPAFGKGQMLWVAADVTTPADHSAHAAHQNHPAAATEADLPTAHHTPGHQPSEHQQHCALCVLAFLGWAPPVDFAITCTDSCDSDRAPIVAATTPRLLLLWTGAQARAPPLPS